MTLTEILEVFERDNSSHVTSGPSAEVELWQLERELGRALPAPFRAFLSRLGGGLFYDRHEIFGTERAMIHDIELVPPLLTIYQRLMTERPKGFSEGLLPFHRCGGVLHFLDARAEGGPTPIVSLKGIFHYADFASFLEAVVLPRTA